MPHYIYFIRILTLKRMLFENWLLLKNQQPVKEVEFSFLDVVQVVHKEINKRVFKPNLIRCKI